ncbi:AfsA-related hotdog domain-containing protein [Nocardia sp. NPDC127579]|uniref:AfsA-related hotdog domain-containing protein n=1 Tax=Nocardia sp. NPDC127579 TaxID=3345402 RepID=UPI003631FFAB
MTGSWTSSPAGRGDGLSFEQLVPRALAHRRALAEVFVADTAPVGDNEFLAAIQLPRAHSLWFDRSVEYHDPMAALEAVRQSLLVIGQRHLGVPGDAQATLQHLRFEVEDLSAFRDNEREPLEGVVRLRPDGDDATLSYFRNQSFEAVLTIAGARALTVHGSGITFPRAVYDDFRDWQRRQQPSPPPNGCPGHLTLEPDRVGRRDPRNVVLAHTAAAPHDLIVVADRRHPSFFDHPYDHLPGPLMLEVFRQAALYTATTADALPTPLAMPTAVTAELSSFAELDADVSCTAVLAGDLAFGEIAVRVELHQHGTRIATARVELTPYPGGTQREGMGTL